MRKALISALVGITFIITACGGVKPVETTPAAPPIVATPSPQPVPEPEPQPVDAVKWFPKGIGLPLVTDDPAAKGKKVVMLTFDDGPSGDGYTATILDTLAKTKIKAVFFVTGYGAKHRDLMERIHREGHILAVHSQTHANLTRLSVADMRKELDPVIQVIESVTGVKPKYFRPPFGAYNAALRGLVKEYNMELINWTNGSRDWEGVKNGYKDPKQVVKDVMSQMHPGAVILFHDTHKHTAEALPEVISQLQADGYEFVVLP